jgi:hypothetical protein
MSRLTLSLSGQPQTREKAFVPQAIRNKRKGVVASSSSSSSQPRSKSSSLRTNPLASVGTDGKNDDGARQCASVVDDNVETTTTRDGGDECDDDRGAARVRDDIGRDNDDDRGGDNPTCDEPYLENEPDALRLLHDGVTRPYDPHSPNDYLAHRERKKTEQARRDMQRSALQRLDQQEKLRRKVEEERRRMIESGDYARIVERSRDGGGDGTNAMMAGGGSAGRGRGRGVTNLPAWLVKKQEEQKEGEGACEERPVSSASRTIDDGRFDDPAA